MSIIQEADHKPSDSLGSRKSSGVVKGTRDDATRVRMKKIMHRVDGKKETSKLVQKLRNEIREAVQDKSSNNSGKGNAFDEKLLKAFQEALVKPKNESVLKSDRSFVRMKKSLLQKGKVRENLTKKIYATSSGRRRRAWDREWEVEFWKLRCKRTKTEKVETLQSVLELLKKATSGNSEMDQRTEGENENSILSRVYLADASVFPRNDDIKPLSDIAGCPNVDNLKQNKDVIKAGYSMADNLKQNNGKGYSNQSMKDSQAEKNNIVQSPQGLSRVSLQKSASSNPGKSFSTSFISDGACLNSNLDGPKSGATSISCSSRSIGSEHNSGKLTGQSETGKSDKRKWALEVLARKNALMNPNGNKEKQEENSSLKGNYPLLAQLPTDMRPVVAPSHHSKVPASVRQAQLYRIAEHYLRRTDLSVIRRTADTELAVADAINVEKDIFERSSSKLVYINLCSQFLSQLSKKPQSVERIASHSPETTTEPTVQVVKELCFEDSPDTSSKVEEALKLAGLSDSPPKSPYTTGDDLNGEYENRENIQGETVENVLDMDSHPELDIYGDFEYDLEDEGYGIPSSNSTLAKVQQENKESKMKVVLSTVRCEETNIPLHDSKKDQSSEGGEDDSRILEVPSDSSTILEGKGESITCDATVDASTGVTLVLDPCQVGIYNELSLVEYEELYGPDKEPLANKISNDKVTGQPSNIESTAAINREKETENCLSRDETPAPKLKTEKSGEKIFADGGALFKKSSPARSLTAEHVQEEGKAKLVSKKSPDQPCSVTKKVEAYVKEHIRPLCKSGVLNVEQYRWAVGKTTEKVMRYHYKAKNANFLIKDGEKVKKLASQYAEASTRQKNQ